MLDERLLERLSAHMDGELSGAEAEALERELASNPELRAIQGRFLALERTAAAQTTPVLSAQDGQALWEVIQERIRDRRPGQAVQPSEPELVSPEAWRVLAAQLPQPAWLTEQQWAKAAERIRDRAAESASGVSSAAHILPLRADMTPLENPAVHAPLRAGPGRTSFRITSLWPALGLTACAAGIALAALLWFSSRQDPPEVVTPYQNRGPVVPVYAAAKSRNEGYFVMVKHIEGVEQPVTCFIKKEEGE